MEFLQIAIAEDLSRILDSMDLVHCYAWCLAIQWRLKRGFFWIVACGRFFFDSLSINATFWSLHPLNGGFWFVVSPYGFQLLIAKLKLPTERVTAEKRRHSVLLSLSFSWMMLNITCVSIFYSTPIIIERTIAGITAAMVNAIPKKNEITTENSSFSSLIARYLMYGKRQP